MCEPKIKYAMVVFHAWNGTITIFQVNCLNLADYGRHAKFLMFTTSWNDARLFAQGLSLNGTVVYSAITRKIDRERVRTDTWKELPEDHPKLIAIKFN